MKALIVSVLLFCVMLGGIALNCHYLKGLSRDMRSAVEAVPHASAEDVPSEEQRTAIDRLEALWESNRETVSLSVTVRVTEGIDDCIGEMRAALRYGDAPMLEGAREHLLRILDDLCRYDAVQFGSVF